MAYTAPRRTYERSLPSLPVVALLLGGVAAGYMSNDISLDRVTSALPGSGCMIKGNISIDGERIYHLPGQEYYRATSVSLLRGERWFCSEADARRAGWRRARI